ncbi:putative nuclease HARBI1 [Camellia sinensis]|uniref:putative nuclease HARBI1 n=1 Tax=Camellia sinensis TaxID=4442 RepID=UPI001035A9DD|nr:putative nuclease HARBI1 [Camellia sinensis]
MSIPDFISTLMFHFSCTALENVNYWEILMCIPDDENVVDWLAALQQSDFSLQVPTRPHGLHNEESVAMFIHTLDGCSNQKLQERFQHSRDTVSRHFHVVLEAMKLFTEVHYKPTRDQNNRHPYLRSRGKYVPSKHCIGALDGTHVEVVLPAHDAGTYYSRKGYPTQNILTVCDFDMCFIFISCGWEGSMHDSRIFNEIIENEHAPFPHPQEGKYYLVGAGYPNKKGYLAPYKGSWYHQAQFRDRGRPDNPRELFHEAHASLRSVVEITFGVWKSR